MTPKLRRAALLAWFGLLACSSSSPGSPSPGAPGDPAAPARDAATTEPTDGLRMPAAGEYVALRDPSYGYSKTAAKAPNQGEPAPDFELPTQTGETLRLSTVLADGPVVLMFYRGFW